MVKVKKTQMDLMKNMEMTNEDIFRIRICQTTDGSHIDEDGNLMDLSDDSVIEKLNAFVGAIGMKEYLNPENLPLMN